MKLKKMIVILLMVILFGCSNQVEGIRTDQYIEAYIGAITEVRSAAEYARGSRYYDISLQLVELDGPKYLVKIDNPQLGMNEVQVVCVANDVLETNIERIQPTLGVFEREVVHLIPFQVKENSEYRAGIYLIGEASENLTNVKVMVTWTNQLYNQNFKEFIELRVEEPINIEEIDLAIEEG